MKKIMILVVAMLMATVTMHAEYTPAEPAVVAMEGEIPPMPEDMPAPDANSTVEEQK